MSAEEKASSGQVQSVEAGLYARLVNIDASPAIFYTRNARSILGLWTAVHLLTTLLNSRTRVVILTERSIESAPSCLSISVDFLILGFTFFKTIFVLRFSSHLRSFDRYVYIIIYARLLCTG